MEVFRWWAAAIVLHLAFPSVGMAGSPHEAVCCHAGWACGFAVYSWPCCGLDWVGLGWVARSCGAVVAAMITVMLRARVQCTWVSYMMGHENSNMLQV